MTTPPNTRPFTAAGFQHYLAEKQFMATRCTACGELSLPPRALCARCHSDGMEWVALSGRGKLAAFTSIYVGLSAMNAQGYGRDNPYLSGIVELEEGVKISARILGLDARKPEGIRIGTPLAIEFLELGDEGKTVLAFRAVA